MRRILHRYVFREIAVPFVFGLSIFTVVLLIARLLKLIELVVNRGVPLGNIVRVFAYIMPAFLEVTVPMAMLLAILVAFGRLSADSEMVAMRSSGLSLYQMLPPIAVVVALSTLATAALSLYVRPWGNRSLRAALYDIARTRATAGIRPQVFNDDFPGLVIYTEAVDSERDLLRRVLISDERDPAQHNRIFAREASMLSDPEAQTVTLRLRDGFIHTTAARGEAEYQTRFETYDVNLDLRQTLAGARRREPERAAGRSAGPSPPSGPRAEPARAANTTALLHPLRVRRFRAGGIPSGSSRSGRPGARVRAQPGRSSPTTSPPPGRRGRQHLVPRHRALVPERGLRGRDHLFRLAARSGPSPLGRLGAAAAASARLAGTSGASGVGPPSQHRHTCAGVRVGVPPRRAFVAIYVIAEFFDRLGSSSATGGRHDGRYFSSSCRCRRR
jgi:lipopolysaccharide export system permease protein